MVWGVWLVGVAVASAPTFVYVSAFSLPADNKAFNPQKWSVRTVTHGVYPIYMLTLNTVLMPYAARFFVKCTGGHENEASKILVGRLFNTLLLPIMATVYMDQQCYRGYLWFWDPCQRGDTTFQLPTGCPFSVNYQQDGTILNDSFPCSVTRGQVCTQGFRSQRCARRVVELLGPVVRA